MTTWGMFIMAVLGVSGHVGSAMQGVCICVIGSYSAVSLRVKWACGLLQESIRSLKCLVFSCQLPKTKLRLLSAEILTNHRGKKTACRYICRCDMMHFLKIAKNC